MAIWKAKCWLGSKSGYQELEVKANTIQGAHEQLQNIYGAEQIINLRQVSSRSSSSDSESSLGGYVILAIVLFLIWVAVEYWTIVLPIAAIVMIGFLYKWFKSL